MALPGTAHARLSADGRVLVLELDKGRGNILDRPMVAALRKGLKLAREPRVAAVVLHGRGDHFSFGASIEDHLPDRIGEFLAQFHGLLRDMMEVSRPFVAAVRGRCLGGGLELAAFCHRVVASPEATFGQPEIKLGVFAPVASLVLPERIGRAAADDLLLGGRTATAEEAQRLGLVDQVDTDPLAAALAHIESEWASLSPSSLSLAVRAARWSWYDSLRRHLDEVERLYLDDLMRTRDAVEGIKAFLEKRAPRWGEAP